MLMGLGNKEDRGQTRHKVGLEAHQRKNKKLADTYGKL